MKCYLQALKSIVLPPGETELVVSVSAGVGTSKQADQSNIPSPSLSLSHLIISPTIIPSRIIVRMVPANVSQSTE